MPQIPMNVNFLMEAVAITVRIPPAASGVLVTLVILWMEMGWNVLILMSANPTHAPRSVSTSSAVSHVNVEGATPSALMEYLVMVS